jgi:acetyl-CoA carboxylase biotin carboxyl carrier protein
VAVHAAAGAAAPAHDAAADDAAAPAATIASPIVGTFYAAPAPDAPPFVKVGDTVDADTVVCIVEAMKVMNEIKAEQCGVIRKVLVDNATPVEFGQPLFEIDPA